MQTRPEENYTQEIEMTALPPRQVITASLFLNLSVFEQYWNINPISSFDVQKFLRQSSPINYTPNQCLNSCLVESDPFIHNIGPFIRNIDPFIRNIGMFNIHGMPQTPVQLNQNFNNTVYVDPNGTPHDNPAPPYYDETDSNMSLSSLPAP